MTPSHLSHSNDQFIAVGEDITDAPGQPAQPWWSRCPIKPLGSRQDMFYFATQRGELREISDSRLFQQGPLLGLFGGNDEWLVEAFPVEGRKPQTADFRHDRAAKWLMQKCVQLPLWDPEMPRRLRGVWIAGDAYDPRARVLIHCGDQVGVVTPCGFEWLDPGFREGGALYYAAPPVVHPDQPATEAEAEQFLTSFCLWRYRQPEAQMIVAGLVCNGMLGQAAPWRSHGLGIAQPGSGKSDLAMLCEAASPLALYFNEFSEAGVRQAMTDEARMVVLDEAEGDRDERGRTAADRAVEFLRRLSGGVGARGVRGTVAGSAMRSTSTGAAILFAVRSPNLDAQDETRFTRFDLVALQAGDDPAAVQKAAGDIRALAPKLWARMLLGRSRYLANLATMRRVLVDLGCPPRQIDQPGSILAAYCTMERDDPATEAYARDLVNTVRWAIHTDAEVQAEGGPARCWSYILTAQPDVWGGGTKRTCGQIIASARGRGPEAIADRKHLQSIGMRLARDEHGEPLGIYIANRAGGLSKIFAGSVWGGGKWGDDLKHLPRALEGHVRIGGDKPRSWFLPLEYLPPEETTTDDADPLAPPRADTHSKPEVLPPPF